MLAKESFPYIEINDEEIYVQKKGVITDVETIRKWLDITTYLAKRFYAAREKLPVAEWEKQTVQAWQNVANANNLSFDPNKFTLQGNYKNFPVHAAIEPKQKNGKQF